MKKLLALVFMSAAFVACDDDGIRKEHQLDSGPKIVGFGSSFETVQYFEDLGTIQREFPVSLIGSGNGQTLSSDVVVNYEIDLDNSTATEGVEFDFIDSSGQMTISAGSTFGSFPLLVNTGQLDPLQKTELVVNLTTANNNTVVGEQYKRLRIVFVGCKSNIATDSSPVGSFYCVVTRDDGAFVNRPTETVQLVDVNTFKTTTTGTWAAGTIAPDQGYNFLDICGDITVPQQGLCQGYYSNQVYGLTSDGTDGLVDDFSTGNEFEVTYEITFAAGNRQYTNSYVRN